MLRRDVSVTGRTVSGGRLIILLVLLVLAIASTVISIRMVASKSAFTEGCGSTLHPLYGDVLADRHCRKMASITAVGVPVYGGAAAFISVVLGLVLLSAPKLQVTSGRDLPSAEPE